MTRHLLRLEAAALFLLLLPCALLARLVRPAPSGPPQVLQACPAVTERSAVTPPPLESLRVSELRALARARGLRGMGSARRAVLLGVLR